METVVSEMFVFVAQFGLFDIWLQGRERIVWKLTTVASLGAVSSASVPRLYPADNAEENQLNITKTHFLSTTLSILLNINI